LRHKHFLNQAADKDNVFTEPIIYVYADASVCLYLASPRNLCLTHEKIPQECMPTVPVPICKNKNGDISHDSNERAISFTTISPQIQTLILSCISPILPPLITSLALWYNIYWCCHVSFCKYI